MNGDIQKSNLVSNSGNEMRPACFVLMLHLALPLVVHPESNIATSVTYGGVDISFTAPSTSEVSVPSELLRVDRTISTNFPLRPGFLLLYDRSTYVASDGTHQYRVSPERNIIPDMFDAIDSSDKCRAVLRWLHGRRSIGFRISHDNLASFISAHSNDFPTMNLTLYTVLPLKDWPAQEFCHLNGVWLAHYCLLQGSSVVDYLHAVREDGRIQTVRRVVLGPVSNLVASASLPLEASSEEQAVEASFERAWAFLERGLHPIFDRGNN